MDEFLGYQFNDTALLRQALTHRSANERHNERLEFLGDAVLSQVVADYLYRKFPDADEGQLTRARAALVKKETLAVVARHHELGTYIVLGDGERKSGGWRRESILANTFEAVIGAIYLDRGFDVVTDAIKTWYGEVLSDFDPLVTHKDPKTRLQEYLQGLGEALPHYDAVAVSGPAHDQCFTIECRVDILSQAVTATGKSRRAGEQRAAELALEALRDRTK